MSDPQNVREWQNIDEEGRWIGPPQLNPVVRRYENRMARRPKMRDDWICETCRKRLSGRDFVECAMANHKIKYRMTDFLGERGTWKYFKTQRIRG